MSSSSLPAPQNAAILTQKLYDSDPDIRYMSLNDLNTIFVTSSGNFLTSDFNACAKIVDGFLHTLNDPNGEVQNMTIKCLGPFVLKAHPDTLCPFIHKIGGLEVDHTVDSSITALAIRQIVTSLPRPSGAAPRSKPVQDAYAAVSKVLIPRLVGFIVLPRSANEKTLPDPPKGLLQVDLEKGIDGNNIDIMIEIARCFGPMLQKAELEALQDITLKLLKSPRSNSVMKKKAVAALSTLSTFFSDTLLSSIISNLIEDFRDVHLTRTNHRLYLHALGSMARTIPRKFGPHLLTLTPFVLSPISQADIDEEERASDDEEHDIQIDEVKEAALAALESFITYCGDDMTRYYTDALEAALRCIKYDPNYTGDDEDEELEEDDSDNDFEAEDEDFEEEGVADDEDDVSWKVRRSAAKVLQTIISNRTKDVMENGAMYDRIVRTLIDRFKEREESVRLEVIATLALLVRKTAGQDDLIPVQVVSPTDVNPSAVLSRKRRRRESDISMAESGKQRRLTGSTSPETLSPPPMGAPASLAQICVAIIDGLFQLMKSASLATKQASVMALQDVVVARQGGLQDLLPRVLDILIDNISSASSDNRAFINVAFNASSATASSLAIESLKLISEISKAHPSSTVQPCLEKVIPSVAAASQSTSSRIACQALVTVEQLIKLLTPPRNASMGQKTSANIRQLLDAIASTLSSRAVDTTARQEAVRVLAVLIGRTSNAKGSKLIDNKQRASASSMLLDAVRNETLRLSAISSIEIMAATVADTSFFDRAWFGAIVLELGAQLRKADRSLRGASLQALRMLLAERGGLTTLDKDASQKLPEMLLPLLSSDDLHMIGPALIIFAAYIESGRMTSLDPTFIASVVTLLKNATAGNVVTQLCLVMQKIGAQGIGQLMMQALLKDVGIDGKPSVLGKVVGNLLVSGGDTVGIKVADFLNEAKTQAQEERRCLALSILGEVGLLSGQEVPLDPDLFMQYFDQASSKVSLDAAIACGRTAAGPGNAPTYVPAILAKASQSAGQKYLALHAIRELLQYNESPETLLPYTHQLWDTAIAASQADNSKEVGAECVASLVLLDPKSFLQRLQALAGSDATSSRSVAILAFRDIFTAADGTYDKYLRPIIVETLTGIMRDTDLENRRSALNSFNAAARNKPGLVLPYLAQLLPLVLDQTLEDPGLIREVTMGPFKHKVDDGLECRKSAYETMYSLVEVAPARVDTTKVFDRIVAGVGDDANIRSLCNLLISKFIILAPEEVERRLDELADKFKVILAQKLKENAVRHEQERVEEAKKGVLRITLDLHKSVNSSSSTRWNDYMEELKKEHKKLLDEAERDMKERERN